MWGNRIATALLGLVGLGIAYIGISFLIDPVGQAAGYVGSAAPDPAHVAGSAKGVRDLVSGVGIAILLMSGQWAVAGWFSLVAALIPAGDMVVVLAQHGPTAVALGVHGATALVMVVAGVLFLRRAPRPAPTPAVTAAAAS